MQSDACWYRNCIGHTMDRTPKPLELVPLDEPRATGPAGDALAEIEIGPMGKVQSDYTMPAKGIDRFLKEATQQYEEGHIDHPLWDRALSQAGNDKVVATESYLHARATVLRLLHRSRRTRRTDALSSVPVKLGGDTVTPSVTTADASERARRPGKTLRHRKAMIAAAALVPLGFGAWLLMSYLGSGSTSGTAVARSVPVSVPPVARSQAPAAATKTMAIGDNGSRPGATPEFLNKIQQLNDAGNWNVLVLYAVEWTRLEPANAAAWSQLSAGYVNLRQYRDALDAANKAVQLAPGDSRLWRNLGQVDMDLNDPAEAVRAFDKALAASPDDATARCLRVSAAQLAAAQKDPRATAKQSTSFDSACRGLLEPVAAR